MTTNAAPVGTQQVVWIDVMGADLSVIDAEFVEDDFGGQRVLVTLGTKDEMIDAIRASGIFDEDATEGIVEELNSPSRRTREAGENRVDVTDLGPTWGDWIDRIVTEGAGR